MLQGASWPLSLNNYFLILALNDSSIGFLLIGKAAFLVMRTL